MSSLQHPSGCKVQPVSWSDSDLRNVALVGMVGALKAHVLETAVK